MEEGSERVEGAALLKAFPWTVLLQLEEEDLGVHAGTSKDPRLLLKFAGHI